MSDFYNLVICTGADSSGFSCLMTDCIPDLHVVPHAQCFPLYTFDFKAEKESDMFDEATEAAWYRHDGISDDAYSHFADFYEKQRPENGSDINKVHVFHYIYGLLHSEDYRKRYSANLAKEIPRIPRVASRADFVRFVNAGMTLGDCHVNYEHKDMFPLVFDIKGGKTLDQLTDADFRVEKMRFGKLKIVEKGMDDPVTITDKSTIIYNENITVKGIPLMAYDYIVNGKPALEWVMERQSVTTHKDSGIVNDANDWATETMGNARYPLELLQRMITVSIETVKVVRALPKLIIDGEVEIESLNAA